MINVHQRNIFSYFVFPILVVVLLFGIFMIVWLRSNVRTVEYTIAELDNKKMAELKERKSLMAEKAGLLSIQNLKEKTGGKLALVFPDRTKVVYVKKGEKFIPQQTSFDGRKTSEN
ncbi:MAG: hypothetical protein LLF28_07665 [Nitrospiraceae bacterium]|nr:hypothetical protein [Nitrospiraceae bacterium]